MKKIIFSFFYLVLSLSIPARAELVGIYIHPLDNSLALEISLSDTTKAGIQKGLSECESKGMWRVFIRIAQAGHPTTTAYAIGCWYVSDHQISIESTTYVDQSPFNITFPTSYFQTTKQFKNWTNYEKYTPLTSDQAKERDMLAAKVAARESAIKDNKQITVFIEHQVQCPYAPFPHEQMRRLKEKGLLEQVIPGRTAVYKVKKEIKIFGQSLLFVSGGGMDGNTEDFITPPKPGITYIPTHFSITLNANPDSELLKIKREGVEPYKSNMQFVKNGSLDGSEAGVTITCGYRPQAN